MDDGVALVLRDGERVEAVAERRGGVAYRVDADDEHELAVRHL